MGKLIGNREVSEVLGRLVAAGRVPNALLFAGPSGVGKRQFALQLARGLMCAHGYAGCGDCSVCRRVGVFSIPTFDKREDSHRVFFSQHPDVGMVVPYKRILQINAIRDLEREANFRPYEANVRLFIIDDAEKMNDQSANALLKTLEEPPATSHIILIASRADTLLPTIRSRVQTIRFAPVPADEIEQHLLSTENFSQEDARLAARVSGGSVGRALSIVPASFRTQRSDMLNVLRAAVSSDRRELLQASEEMTDAKNKEEYEEKLEILKELIHDVWLIANGAPAVGIRNSDIASELEQIAARASANDLAAWIAEIETLQENLIVNLNRRVATDALFVAMAG